MSLKILSVALALLIFSAHGVLAGDQLTDAQLDHVTAGGVNPPLITSAPTVTLPTTVCDGCTVITETDGGTTLTYTGGFAGLLQSYYQHLVDKGYTNQ